MKRSQPALPAQARWIASGVLILRSCRTRANSSPATASKGASPTKGPRNKALYFAYYHLKKENVEEFTAGEAAKWISVNRLGAPNTARLKANLVDSSRTVKGSKAGTFRLHHNFIKAMDAEFPHLSEESQEVMDSGAILPPVAYEKTRGFIESLAKQVNVCYEVHAYDGCAVLMRRLEEVLLIMSFQKLGIDSEIQDGNGNYRMLEAIVTNAQNNTKLKLSRNGKQTIEKIRELGNYSAHQITYQCRREYIAEKIDEYRALVQELLVKAGIR